MVRLKDRKFNIKYDPYDNFNSSMVRLKVPLVCIYSITPTFQFQYGAIERIMPLFWRQCTRVFQFQYGAIESCTDTPAGRKISYFNSSMVRLKAPSIFSSLLFLIFQFQYGAIERNYELRSNYGQ